MPHPYAKRFMHPVPGNIDLNSRPVVPVEGGYATIRSIGIGTDKGETLIPTVHPEGRVMTDEEAIDRYDRTGQHLGRFPTVEQANHYAERLHSQQANQYGGALHGLLK